MNESKRYAVGLDLGTSTISAAVLDLHSGALAASRTVPNDTALDSTGVEREHDAAALCRKAQALLDSLLDEIGGAACIGLTGQMHGIVYRSGQGELLSPLMTWQDGRAGVGDPSPCQRIADLTGYETAPGYGLATCYADLLAGRIPAGTAKLATVMDCFGCRLTGRADPLVHAGNAASLGLFDLERMDFDRSAVRMLGLDPGILPAVTTRAEILGSYHGIPVSTAIGDNQAAFLGSVRDPDSMVLANFGTGSQISLTVQPGAPVRTSRSAELRPFLENRMLASGSALYGGAAYALLEHFFGRYAAEAGWPGTEQYEVMNRLALEAAQAGRFLHVRTTFGGTRDDPALRGMISDIGAEDFTPGALAAGVLRGMAEELYSLYERFPHDSVRTLVLSGNAARKNPALPKIAQMVFGLPALIPVCREEAALGAALFAADAAGLDAEAARQAFAYRKVEA